jgi:enoyl-CoA hydratase/carnithine racemase
MPASGELRVEVDGELAIVTMHRPECRNALNVALRQGLVEIATSVEADPGIRAWILTGAGSAFCAGADLKERLHRAPGPQRSTPSFFRLIRRKPVIAAVNGPAVGGGFELVLACDLAVAARSAVFSLPEVRRGLVPGGGGSFRLARLVGPRRATELLLTGASIDAGRSAALGIVNRVVADESLIDSAIELGRQIVKGGPLAISAVLDLSRGALDGPESNLWARTDEVSRGVGMSADAAEGALAFVEKRAPVWRGR